MADAPTVGARRVHKGVESLSDETPEEQLPTTHEFFTSDATAPEDPDADAPPVAVDETEPPLETAAPPPAAAEPGAGAPATPAVQGTEPPSAAVTTAGAPALPAAVPEPTPEAEKAAGFPWSQLKQAQRERDQLQARLAQIEQDQLAAQARLAQAQQVLNPQQPAQPWTRASGRVPTPTELETLRNEDPLEYNAVTAEMALRQAQEVQQQQQLMQTQMQIRADIDSFSRTQPDYTDAAKFLEDRENKRWQALGFTPEQAQQMTQARAGMVVDAAMRMGRPVPQAIYDLALADGWTVPQPAAAPNGNGAAPAVVAEPTPAEKLATSKARTQAAQGSLGSVPSGPTKTNLPIDHERAMQLTEEEMERLDREQPGWDSQL